MSAFELDVRFSAGPRTLHSTLTTDARRIAIVGRSGIGKSTLLRTILGFDAEADARVMWNGRSLGALPVEQRRFGWVPQDALLFPHLDVRHNIGFSLDADVPRLADLLDLGPLLTRPVSALSGGERQRVAIARALAMRPSLLVLDEPISALDRDARARVVQALEDWRAVVDFTSLVVSHDEMDVSALADEVYEMSADGSLTPRSSKGCPASPG